MLDNAVRKPLSAELAEGGSKRGGPGGRKPGSSQAGLEKAASATQPARQVVLVLGMHRSGTSALAGVLSLLGAELPASLMPASQTNAKGYFESIEFARLHDELLAAAGTAWFSHDKIASSWFRSAVGESFAGRIAARVMEEFQDLDFFVVKDPRICRFVPLWLDALARLDVQPKAVISFRNPVDVARSLHARDGWPVSHSYVVWLRHMLDAERDSRGVRRAFVAYDSLIADWRAVFDRLGRQLSIDLFRRSSHSDREVDAFLTTELRHSSTELAELEGRSDLVSWMVETCRALHALERDPYDASALSKLDQVRASFDEACSAFSPVIESFAVRLDDAAQAISSLEGARQQAEATAQRLLARDADLAGLRARVEQFEPLAIRVEAVEQALAEIRSRTAAEVTALAPLREEADALRSRLAQAEAERSRLVLELETAGRSRADMQTQFDQLAAQLAAARREADRATELEQFARIQAERATRSEDECTVVRAQLAAQLATARREADRATELEQLARIQAERATRSEDECTVARAQLAATRTELAGRQRELHTKDAEIQRLLQTASGLRGELDRARTAAALERGALSGRIEALRGRVGELAAFEQEAKRKRKAHFWGSRRRPDPVNDARRRAIAESGLFDPDWYFASYPDVEVSGLDALEHFVACGSREGRSPGPDFDAGAYLREHPEAAEGDNEPLLHLLQQRQPKL